MKIPETSANVAAYYGNEENGQWQTNGVTLEAGGGPAAGGDAGFLPLYPHPHAHTHPHPHPHPHARTHHDPAYIMTGAYYPSAYQPLQPLPAHPHVHHAPVAPPPPPAAPDDFADYMWMENEEEFDKQVMQQLEEEALMEQCIEAMLEDERERDRRRPHANGHRTATPNFSNGTTASLQEQVSKSKLNPLAAEFVPTGSRTAPSAAPEAAPPSPAERVGGLPDDDENEKKPSKPPTPEVSAVGCELPIPESTMRQADAHAQDEKQEEVIETPEVSAAPPPESSESDNSAAKSLSEHKEQPRSAKTVKAEPKKLKNKPAAVKPVVDARKRDARRQKHSSKSETEEVSNTTTPISTTVESEKGLPRSSPSEDAATVPKPINYAAAAKANKPKKSSPVPTQPVQPAEKTSPVASPTNAAPKSQDKPPRTEKVTTPAKTDKRKGSNK